MGGMPFEKDKASLVVSILALAVSIASPFASYRWLNQVERDDRDRKQLTAWIIDGAGGGEVGGDFDSDLVSSAYTFDIVARKGGVLPVGNVQFLLQFDPIAVPYLKVNVNSAIETEPTTLDGEGRLRIRLKNPLAPTATDVHIPIEVSMSGHMKDKVFAGIRDPLRGIWLYSDAIAGLPISLSYSSDPKAGHAAR
jgi:hypothetical protein